MADLTLLQQASIWTGMAAGIGGLTLGILNAVHQRSISRPRIRVEFDKTHLLQEGARPAHAHTIQIGNVGRVAVFGGMIGGIVKRDTETKQWFVYPVILDGGKWPRTIEPGHQALLGIDVAQFGRDTEPHQIRTLTFTSAIGKKYKAKRRSLKKFRQAMAEASKGV